MRDTGHRTPVQGATDTMQRGMWQGILCRGVGVGGTVQCAGTPEDWETSQHRIYTPETQFERSNTLDEGKGEGLKMKDTQIGFTSDTWLKDPWEAPLIEGAITW